MNTTSDPGFDAEKQHAIARMREMNNRSKYRQTSAGASGKGREEKPPDIRESAPDFGIPFLRGIGSDPDTSLILGLALILLSEKSDKLLLLALLYILL